MSRFKILDESALTLDEAVKERNSDMKDLLKQKWAEVNGEKNEN